MSMWDGSELHFEIGKMQERIDTLTKILLFLIREYGRTGWMTLQAAAGAASLAADKARKLREEGPVRGARAAYEAIQLQEKTLQEVVDMLTSNTKEVGGTMASSAFKGFERYFTGLRMWWGMTYRLLIVLALVHVGLTAYN